MCPAARVSYEPTGLTPAATSCTSSYLVGLSGASSVCGVTPSPKNGGRRDYMFGNDGGQRRCSRRRWRPAARAAMRRRAGTRHVPLPCRPLAYAGGAVT